MRHLNSAGGFGQGWSVTDIAMGYVSGGMQKTPRTAQTRCRSSSPEVNTKQRLHNRSQGPSEAYRQICSCANFRFSLRVQRWSTICLFVSPLARLAFCQPDVCHMQAVSQPPCSTSLHALCAHSDPSASVVAEEEVFLIVCILFTTILLRGINVFSCSRALLVTKQNKQKIHHFPNSWMPQTQQQERKGEERGGEERKERMDYTKIIFVLFKWMGRDN